MRITRVYTRTGDKGTTRLVGGSSVAKDDPRIESYGTVDELNAILGLVRVANADDSATEQLDAIVHKIQNDLFNLGSELATPADSRWEGMIRMTAADIERLESWCDELNESLPPLKEFILPGGGAVGAHLHHARTVCRRAERRTVTLFQIQNADVDEPEEQFCVRYLNRLSDLLFILSRWAARERGEPEIYWDKPTKS